MTYREIQLAFPHSCAHPGRLCRVCWWVRDHWFRHRYEGVLPITNDIAPVAQSERPHAKREVVGTLAVEDANEIVPRSRPAPLDEIQPGAPFLLRAGHISITEPTLKSVRIIGPRGRQ